MELKLTGSLYVTGGGSGIGQHTALAFAQCGVRKIAIVGLYRNQLEETQELLKSRHPEIETLLFEGDVTNESFVQESVKESASKFGRIDYAVNSAGTAGKSAPTHEASLKDWQQVIDVNQTGVWLCQKYLIAQMLTQESQGTREGRGSIINISSMFGRVSSPAGFGITAYCTSKHAVIGLTKADAKVYAPLGIRINAICPGWVETPVVKEAIAKGLMVQELQKTPMGRGASLDEVSDTIVFMASPMASFMHGVDLALDGGYSL